MDEANGNIGSLWVSLGVDTSQLTQGMRQAEQQATTMASRVSQRLNSMATGLQGLVQKWGALPLAIAGGIFSIEQAFGAFRRFYDMAKEGAKDMRMEESFKGVADSFGADADEMTKKMVSATGRVVQETQLQATAMRGMMQGMTEKSLVDLAGASKIFARTTGQSTGDVFNSMVNAVTMQMPRQLMRLRIITRDEMREIQKAISMGAIGKADIAEEIVRKAEIRKEQMKAVGYDIYFSFTKFGRAWDEFIEVAGKLASVTLAPILEGLTALIDLVTGVGNVLLSILLPILKPIYKAFSNWLEVCYKQAESLWALWRAVDQGKESIDKLAESSILLTSLMGWKKLIDAIQLAIDKLDEYLNKYDQASGKRQGGGGAPDWTLGWWIKTLSSHPSEEQANAEKKKIDETSLLARRAREIEIAHETMKMNVEVKKQENAAILDVVKARHSAEVKLFEAARKHELEMAKRSGITSAESFNMQIKTEEERNSKVYSNAMEEAALKRRLGKEELELTLQLENEKKRYKLETMVRDLEAMKQSPEKDRKLQEIADYKKHMDALTNITRTGRLRILDIQYNAAAKQAKLNDEIARAETGYKKEEGAPLEDLKHALMVQTLKLEYQELEVKKQSAVLDDKVAAIRDRIAAEQISEISGEEQILAVEKERLAMYEKQRAVIEEQAKNFVQMKAVQELGITVNPYETTLEQVIKINEHLQNNSSFTDEIKNKWQALRDALVSITNQVMQQNRTVEDGVTKIEKARRSAVSAIGPAGGLSWITEQIRQMEKQKQDYRDAQVDETSIHRYEMERRRQIDLQYYTWQLENAQNLNDTMLSRAKMMLNEVHNAYTAWANAVADSMQRTFSDVFFDFMEGKLKTLQEYLTSFASSMNRAIADFLSKKLTGNIMEFLFPGSTAMTVPVINAAVLNVENMPALNEQSWQGAGGGGGQAPVQSSGFTGALSEMWTGIKDWFGGLNIFHEGGVVGASGEKGVGVAGLKPNEMVAVLEKGEVVIPKGGVSDFIEKFGRAAGGPVAANTGYLVGEGGRELFAPQYTGPIVSSATARAAEEAAAGKRVAALEAKDLAQYTEEFNEYRKYELEMEEYNRQQKEKMQQQKGGLMSMLPTLLSYGLLGYGKDIWNWGKNILGIGMDTSPAALAGDVSMADMAGYQALQTIEASKTTAAAAASDITAEEVTRTAISQRAAEIRATGDLPTTPEGTIDLTTAKSTFNGGLPAYQTGAEIATATTAAATQVPGLAILPAANPLPGAVFAPTAQEATYAAVNIGDKVALLQPEYADTALNLAPVETATPWSSFLGPAAAGWFAGGLSKGVKEFGDIASLGGWLSGGDPERQKRLGGTLAGGVGGAIAAGAMAGSIVPGVGTAIGAGIGALMGYLSQGGNFGTLLSDAGTAVTGLATGLWGAAEGVGKGIWSAGESAVNWFTGSSGPLHGFGLWAEGGPIKKGQFGLVGEQGPELFVPQTSGMIIPNDITEQFLSNTKDMFLEVQGAMPSTYTGPSTQDIIDKYGGFPLGLMLPPDFATTFAQNTTPTSLEPIQFAAPMANQTPMQVVSSMFGRAAGGPVSAHRPYIVGESGIEAFIPNTDGGALPRYHSGGVVGGGSIPHGVPNQIVNVTNQVAAPREGSTPVVVNHNVSVNVSSMDGQDAFRVFSANRDALASIFSEMRFDNNSRLRR